MIILILIIKKKAVLNYYQGRTNHPLNFEKLVGSP
jgi:hypothetical protein